MKKDGSAKSTKAGIDALAFLLSDQVRAEAEEIRSMRRQANQLLEAVNERSQPASSVNALEPAVSPLTESNKPEPE
jgi:hypothetical protein